MLRISIALAFVLSVALSPGKFLIEPLIGMRVLQTLHPGQRGAVLAVMDFWLPAAIIYLLLRLVPIASRLTPNPRELRAITIANAVLALYFIARVFASTIEGGGAGFLVGSLSVFTAMPALVVLAVALATVFIRALRDKRTLRPVSHLGAGEAVSVAFIGFGPVVYAVAALSMGSDSPLQVSQAVGRRMTALCSRAGQQIARRPEVVVDGLFFAQDSASRYCKIRNGVYGTQELGTVAEGLVNLGYLRYTERPREQPGAGANRDAVTYDRYLVRQPRQNVVDLSSKYGVYRRTLVTQEEAALGFEGYELLVKVISSDEIVGTHAYIANHKTGAVCGAEVNSCVDEQRFIVDALGLQRRYDTLYPTGK